MAFTKNPTQDSHNVTRIPVGGEPVLTSSTNPYAVTSYCINGFALNEEYWDKQETKAIHKFQCNATALSPNSITTSGEFNQISVQTYGSFNIFFTRGVYGYYYNYYTGTIGNWLTAGTSLAGAVHTNFIDSTNARRVAVITSGGVICSCLEDGSSGASYAIPTAVSHSGGLVFINGYLFALNTAGTRIYNSAPNGVWNTWNTTDYLDAEQYADKILYISKHHNYLVAHGQSSTEFFYDNAIEVGSPLARQESYSSRVGVVLPVVGSLTLPCVANIEDDLYFVGTSETGSRNLWRIRNFKLEQIGNMYIQNLLNDPNANYAGITTQVINGNPNIVIEFESASAAAQITWAYLPQSDYWWKIYTTTFPTYHYRAGTGVAPLNPVYTTIPRMITLKCTSAGDGYVYAYYPDPNWATEIYMTYVTEIIDFGTNRYKAISRIDAIGDFNTNSVNLSINQTPYYGSTYSDLGTKYPSTIGYGNNVSWYKCGSPRQFSLQYYIVGTKPCILRATEIEYDIGVA